MNLKSNFCVNKLKFVRESGFSRNTQALAFDIDEKK